MAERLLYIFFIGSVSGWILETVYRRFCHDNKSRKWINPGFMMGPYLPLYGFGFCILFLLSELENAIMIVNPLITKLIVCVLMALCMTILELAAGLIFIKGMKLELWDYSSKPFNYKGIICAEFSFYWLVLALLYTAAVHPVIYRITGELIKEEKNLFPLGFISGIFAVDFCCSMHIATKIKKFAEENDILVRYEELKTAIRKYAEERKEKYMFMFAFHSKINLNDHLKRYLDLYSRIRRQNK